MIFYFVAKQSLETREREIDVVLPSMTPILQRMRFRFSLRTLLVFVTLFCALTAWLGWRYREARLQEAQCIEFQHCGGFAVGWADDYEEDFSWIDWLLGPTFSTRPLTLHMSPIHADGSAAPIDRQWKLATQITGPISLYADCKIEAHHWPLLAQLKNVRSLTLPNIDLPQQDNVIAELSHMPRLENLTLFTYNSQKLLERPKFTVEMARQLARCERLDTIYLRGFDFDEAVLEEIENHERLRQKTFAIVEYHLLTEEQTAKMKSCGNFIFTYKSGKPF